MPAISPIKLISDLGIVEPWDIDSDKDYLSALMEGVNTLSVSNASDKRIPILQDEVKRLRLERKKADPNFKVTNKKISADGFKKGSSVGGAQKVAADTTGASALALRGSSALSTDVKSLETGDKGGDNFTEFQGTIEKIAGTVDSIHDTLISQAKQEKVWSRENAKADEDKKRGLREKILESKGFKMLAKGVGKVLAPVRSMFSKVVNFITSLIMGRVIVNIMKWWSDPANQEKANSIIRFAGDWWPVFAAGFLIFGTGLAGLVKGLTLFIVPLIKPLAAATLALLSNPWVAGAVALGLGAWGIHSLVSGKGEKPPAKRDKEGGVDDEQSTEIRQGATQDRSDANKTETTPGFATGGLVAQPREYSSGGRVSGPGGVDKVPARLTAGEFVMSKGAVDKWGAGTLAAMNAMGGGTNRPKMGGYEGGGEVSSIPSISNEISGLAINHLLNIVMASDTIGDVINKVTSHTIKVVNEGDTNNISAKANIETPEPPSIPEQEVIVTPIETPPNEGAGASPDFNSTVPPFEVVPGWHGMSNKVKVLGFVR